jgi:predicted ribonuclease YlaK
MSNLVPMESRSENVKVKLNDIKFKAKSITKNHERIIQSFSQDKNLIISGCAGTGKTFMSLNLSLQNVLDYNEYETIMIIRSIVPIRDIGFMKGNKEEKCEEYEKPYINICTETFDCNGMIYNRLKKQNYIDFQPTSFNQGVTFKNTIIIVDEAQNLNYTELFNIMTRIGKNSKIIFAGDYRKQDMLNKKSNDKSGFKNFISVIESSDNLMNKFDIIDMNEEDIVRSELVKDFIIADNNFKF